MSNSLTILIAGGTGLVGTHLTRLLTGLGHKVIILTRTPGRAKAMPGVSYAAWDVERGTIDAEAIGAADAIVNLAGAGVVDKPWTPAYKKLIQESRTGSAALICRALQEYPNKVATVVNASAQGWYGEDAGGPHFTEDAPPAKDFLGETCRLWEDSIRPVEALQKRLVILRLGIVLAMDGGAMAEFRKPLAFRVAGVLGSGRQMVSWIHMADLCLMILFAIEHPQVSGVYNAVAPNPVSNEALTLALGKAMYGRAFLKMHVPSFALKLLLGARSIEVLKSCTVSARRIQEAGFRFTYPDIEGAMKDLVGVARN